MSILQYISLAVSPVLLIVMVIFIKNNSSLTSFTNIRNSILFGFAAALLLFIASYLIDLRWQGNLHNMRRLAFFVFVVIAFSSELGKFIPMRLMSYNFPSFKGPMEGIIYSIATGLGFSAIASVLFAYGFVGKPINSLTLFLFLYPFANIVFSIALGFFLGMGKLRKNALIDHSTGLFLATFLNGMFYFSFITSDVRLFVITLIGLVIISIALLYRAIQLFNKRD